MKSMSEAARQKWKCQIQLGHELNTDQERWGLL